MLWKDNIKIDLQEVG